MASAETIEVPTLLPPREPHAPPRLRLVALAAVSALVVGGTALFAGTMTRPATSVDSLGTVASAAATGDRGAQRSAIDLADQRGDDDVQPISAATSAASVGSTAAAQADVAADLHGRLVRSLPKVQVVTAEGMHEGSGFFLTSSGHIATSARLLRNSEYVIVWADGNRRFPAEIMGTDSFSDIALLKIEPATWQAAEVAEGATLHVGQSTLTIDHNRNQMMHGQVASPFGTIRGDGQPSSPRVLISKGPPAGSAVVDETGAIIAMSTGLTDGPSGDTIATPAWLIQRVALDMLVSGNSSHAWLGAEVAGTDSSTGVTITEIAAQSPAHAAGLQVGDEIERFDDVAIDSLEALMRELYAHSPGDEINLMVTRQDSRRVVSVALGSLFD